MAGASRSDWLMHTIYAASNLTPMPALPCDSAGVIGGGITAGIGNAQLFLAQQHQQHCVSFNCL